MDIIASDTGSDSAYGAFPHLCACPFIVAPLLYHHKSSYHCSVY